MVKGIGTATERGGSLITFYPDTLTYGEHVGRRKPMVPGKYMKI